MHRSGSIGIMRRFLMLAFLLPAVGGRAWRRFGIRRTAPAPATVRSPPSLAEEAAANASLPLPGRRNRGGAIGIVRRFLMLAFLPGSREGKIFSTHGLDLQTVGQAVQGVGGGI